ncbi:MAG TPA: FG-GAP-like repeat-containing protein [Bacteroidia bacterium]|nr:FG-GAP-like repeat-containing protein [Bacteroidia bacterium]
MTLLVRYRIIATLAFFSLMVSLYSCESKRPHLKQSGNTLFTLLDSSETGIAFTNTMLHDSSVINTYEYRFNGAGVAVADINNDGLMDLFFSGTNAEPRLYLNKGNLKFEDITEKAGIKTEHGVSTGVSITDINGDGYVDFYLCRTGKYSIDQRRNKLFVNNGDLTFTEMGQAYGLDDPSYSNQAVFFDMDNDGDQDMYLVNQPIDYTYANTVMIKPDTALQFNCGKLFRNEGNGHFTDISSSAGVYRKAFGFNASVTDFNNDGYWDLYVTNDYLQPDYLYINNGNGTFTESLAKYMKHCSNSSMGSCIGDFNNDGLEDVFVLDMIAEDNERQKLLRGPMGYDDFYLYLKSGAYYQYMRNMLQLNNGNGTFSEIGQLAGVSNTDWSWGPILEDLDNDGNKDLFVANGYRRDLTNMDYVSYFLDSINKIGGIGIYSNMSEMFEALPETPLQNYAFRNNGDLTFTNQSDQWGLTQKTFSNGSVAADLDNDGDLEIIINNIDQPATIYKCNVTEQHKNHFLDFKLSGNKPNTLGAGADIKVYTAGKEQCEKWFPAQGYMSAKGNSLHFGMGGALKADSVYVTWQGGKVQRLYNVSSDTVIKFDEKDATMQNVAKQPRAQLFEDVSATSGIDFKHHESMFIDYKREPLLPQLFSEPGPAFASGDINGDGREDIFIGGAAGQSGEIYEQEPDGEFKKLSQPDLNKDKAFEDAAALFFDADGDGDLDLYVCSGSNEFAESSPNYQDRLYINEGRGNFVRNTRALPGMLTSTACVTAGDIDGDGDLDLFVGGRIIPWKYPVAPRSYILINEKGFFSDRTAAMCPELMHPGLVTTAIWSDFDNDKRADLIIAGQWMPISVYHNTGTKLIPLKAETAGLEKSDGWWNCIHAADIDNDGYTDYILGNRGNNSRIKASEKEPASVTANDFDGNGTLDAIMCYYIQGKSYPVHGRDQLTDQIRPLKNTLLRYRDYAHATLNDIFPKAALDTALTLYAYTFASSYMHNNGNGTFTLRPLPTVAQFSAVNGIVTGDYDGDGILDILLAGNDYSPDVETGRYDASIGCFLKGDGKGSFTVLPVTKTGFFADGYIKGMKMISADNQRLIVVVRNNDTVKVLRSLSGAGTAMP